MKRVLLGILLGLLAGAGWVAAQDDAPPVEVHWIHADGVTTTRYDCYPVEGGTAYPVVVYVEGTEGIATFGCQWHPYEPATPQRDDRRAQHASTTARLITSAPAVHP